MLIQRFVDYEVNDNRNQGDKIYQDHDRVPQTSK